MNDLDQKIQAALRRGESADSLGDEPNLAEEVVTAFRGRRRWLTTLAIIFNLVAFVGVVWSAMRFYEATDVTVQLRWGGLAGALLLMNAMLKLWFWLEMQTNRVLREVKRVELLVLTRQSR